MANVFKNYTSASVGTSPVTTYTVPGATVAVTIGLTIANTTASQITVDVQVLASTWSRAHRSPLGRH
jgi:hypothetical protein